MELVSRGLGPVYPQFSHDATMITVRELISVELVKGYLLRPLHEAGHASRDATTSSNAPPCDMVDYKKRMWEHAASLGRGRLVVERFQKMELFWRTSLQIVHSGLSGAGRGVVYVGQAKLKSGDSVAHYEGLVRESQGSCSQDESTNVDFYDFPFVRGGKAYVCDARPSLLEENGFRSHISALLNHANCRDAGQNCTMTRETVKVGKHETLLHVIKATSDLTRGAPLLWNYFAGARSSSATPSWSADWSPGK